MHSLIVFTTFSLLMASSEAALLYSSAGPITINESGAGINLAGLSLARSSTATDTVYFQYSASNLASNSTNENYYAGMVMYDGGTEKLGVGNAWPAFAYSAFNTSGGANKDLNSATPEAGQTYQLVRLADTALIVFRVDFVNGGDDNITVWLNPNLSATEAAQNPALKTTFTADATFTEVHLREGGGGTGWDYSGIRIASSGTDVGFFAVPEPGSLCLLAFGGLSLARRRR